MTLRQHLGPCAAALASAALLAGTVPGAAAAPGSPRAEDGPATVPSAGPSDAARTTAPGVYVVTLAGPPAAEYAGGLPGLAATRPAGGRASTGPGPPWRPTPGTCSTGTRTGARPGRRPRGALPLHDRAQRLRGHADHPAGAPAAARAGRGPRRAQHQAAHRPGPPAAPVVGRSSRRLLGLDGPGGVWARHGGPARAGRGVVVGVVDTGIWPENPSFTGLPQRTPGTARALPGFHGACARAQDWSASDCTDKVVSARWFVSGFGEENLASTEYLSARDGTGHGSHVASVAAGDHGVRVQVDGQRFGTTSGMAPAARLAVYKACWTAPDPDDDGCSTADTVAAVDRAVADGVDVLSYSVSAREPAHDPDDSVERAFLGAASAGVFVATSAGNGGRAGTVAAHRPLGHHGRAPAPTTTFQGAVRLGDRPGCQGVRRGDGLRPPGAPRADRARRRRRRARRRRGPSRSSAASGLARRGEGGRRRRGVRPRRRGPGRQVGGRRRGRRRRHGARQHAAPGHRRRRARRTDGAPRRRAGAPAEGRPPAGPRRGRHRPGHPRPDRPHGRPGAVDRRVLRARARPRPSTCSSPT